MDPVHHHVVRDNKNKNPMLDSVFILLYFLTQKMDTAYIVNDIKCVKHFYGESTLLTVPLIHD